MGMIEQPQAAPEVQEAPATEVVTEQPQEETVSNDQDEEAPDKGPFDQELTIHITKLSKKMKDGMIEEALVDGPEAAVFENDTLKIDAKGMADAQQKKFEAMFADSLSTEEDEDEDMDETAENELHD